MFEIEISTFINKHSKFIEIGWKNCVYPSRIKLWGEVTFLYHKIAMKSSRIGFSISDFVYYCHLYIYIITIRKKKTNENLSPHQVS